MSFNDEWAFSSYRLGESTSILWGVKSDLNFIQSFDENSLSKQNRPRWGAAFWGYFVCLCPIKGTPGLNELHVISLDILSYLRKHIIIQMIFSVDMDIHKFKKLGIFLVIVSFSDYCLFLPLYVIDLPAHQFIALIFSILRDCMPSLSYLLEIHF